MNDSTGSSRRHAMMGISQYIEIFNNSAQNSKPQKKPKVLLF